MPPRAETMNGRNAGIDVLRGIAILMVLLLHFSLTYRLWHSGFLANLIGHDWALSVLGSGNFAVTMFFVVSGFLIATNAAERAGSLGKIRPRAFYIRRVRAAHALPRPRAHDHHDPRPVRDRLVRDRGIWLKR